MQITVDEFESVTNEAFSFLTSDFGYSAKPPKRGGHFGTALIRMFVKGNLKIHFSFGDADSNDLCSIAFNDGIDAKVRRRHMERTLSILLRDRLPSYRHKTSDDLACGNLVADIILEYGRLLRDYGADVVKGDFSAFPTLVYLLVHVASKQKALDIGRPVGIFSSLELAEKAIINRHEQVRGYEGCKGYEIWSMDIDPARLIRPADFGLPGT
jgi:hypothetical protein